MMTIHDVHEWLARLDPNNNLGVDEGGLTLVEVDPTGRLTGQCLEIGGVPDL
jgi:hypothetical protein